MLVWVLMASRSQLEINDKIFTEFGRVAREPLFIRLRDFAAASSLSCACLHAAVPRISADQLAEEADDDEVAQFGSGFLWYFQRCLWLTDPVLSWRVCEQEEDEEGGSSGGGACSTHRSSRNLLILFCCCLLKSRRQEAFACRNVAVPGRRPPARHPVQL